MCVDKLKQRKLRFPSELGCQLVSHVANMASEHTRHVTQNQHSGKGTRQDGAVTWLETAREQRALPASVSLETDDTTLPENISELLYFYDPTGGGH